MLFRYFLAVQEERGPRKPKLRNFYRPESYFIKDNNNVTVFYGESNATYEEAAHIFLTAIKSARHNKGFGTLNRNSQNIILGMHVFIFSLVVVRIPDKPL